MCNFKKSLAIFLAFVFVIGSGFADVGAAFGVRLSDDTADYEILTDSDYDGIPDSYDSAPNDNTFSGRMKSGHDGTTTVSYTMDYRNFFSDNTVYNEAIAAFSTWAAQFTYENDDGATAYTPSAALS